MKSIYKNQKIKILIAGLALVLVASLGLFVQSCSQEYPVSNVVDRKQANAIATQYLVLQGNQYVLNLSEEQAISLGISKNDYDRMQKEVTETNAFIVEAQAQGMKIEISDPQKTQNNTTIPRLKDDTETPSNYGGTFYFSGPDDSEKYESYVPYGYSKVTFYYTTDFIVNIVVFKVWYAGKVFSQGSKSGSCCGSVTLSLPTSGEKHNFTGAALCGIFGCNGQASITYSKQ